MYQGKEDSSGSAKISFTTCKRPPMTFTSRTSDFKIGDIVKFKSSAWPHRWLDYRVSYDYQVAENGNFTTAVASEGVSSDDVSIEYQFPLIMIE